MSNQGRRTGYLEASFAMPLLLTILWIGGTRYSKTLRERPAVVYTIAMALSFVPALIPYDSGPLNYVGSTLCLLVGLWRYNRELSRAEELRRAHRNAQR